MIASSTGGISGTPTTSGTTSFTVKVTNSSSSVLTATANLSIAIALATSAMNVSTSGNQILVNGSPGTLKGFTFVGVTNPTTCASSFYSTAAYPWAASELSSAQSNFHINVVRLRVALDLIHEPSSQGFSSTYVANYICQVGIAVALARSKGLAVIVSMQWEGGASGTSVCDQYGVHGITLTGDPTSDNAAAAWEALLGSSAWTSNTDYTVTPQDFLIDTGVLLEIYNEPSIGTIDGTASSWIAWQNALQPLVTAIRDDGADNVLIVPGLASEKMLDATPIGGDSVASYMLTDSQDSHIYAVHPYPYATTGTSHTISFCPRRTGTTISAPWLRPSRPPSSLRSGLPEERTRIIAMTPSRLSSPRPFLGTTPVEPPSTALTSQTNLRPGWRLPPPAAATPTALPYPLPPGSLIPPGTTCRTWPTMTLRSLAPRLHHFSAIHRSRGPMGRSPIPAQEMRSRTISIAIEPQHRQPAGVRDGGSRSAAGSFLLHRPWFCAARAKPESLYPVATASKPVTTRARRA